MQPESQRVNLHSIRRRPRRRVATTLVEVLIVITLVSLLLSIVGTLAVRLRQWDRQMLDRTQHGAQLIQLTDSIRSDIRHASRVSQPDQKTIAISNSDGREIRYELETDGCRRIVKSSGKASPPTDTFTIGAAQSWKLDAAAGRRPAYTVTLEHSNTDHAGSNAAPFFVYAAVGADMP